jgi:hypothetical protein
MATRRVVGGGLAAAVLAGLMAIAPAREAAAAPPEWSFIMLSNEDIASMDLGAGCCEVDSTSGGGVVLVEGDGQITAVDTRTGTEVPLEDPDDFTPTGAAIAPDGWIVTAWDGVGHYADGGFSPAVGGFDLTNGVGGATAAQSEYQYSNRDQSGGCENGARYAWIGTSPSSSYGSGVVHFAHCLNEYDSGNHQAAIPFGGTPLLPTGATIPQYTSLRIASYGHRVVFSSNVRNLDTSGATSPEAGSVYVHELDGDTSVTRLLTGGTSPIDADWRVRMSGGGRSVGPRS